MKSKWQILVDTGGTFTDCIAIDPLGKLRRLKLLSSSALRGKIIRNTANNTYLFQSCWDLDSVDLSGYAIHSLNGSLQGMVEDLDLKSGTITIDGQDGWEQSDFEIISDEEVPVFACRLLTGTSLKDNLPDIELRLGSTRGTNALLERKIAPTALIINKGFEDLILIGTQQRPDIFSLQIEKPRPLYESVYGITGRISSDGSILQDLDPSEIRSIVHDLIKNGINCCAVALINSYRNPDHEQQVARILEEAGISYVSASSSLSGSIKFLSRTQTSVVNACLSPVIVDYINGIREKLSKDSIFNVMASSGGLASANRFAPKDSLLSGPAGGIIGAASIAELSGTNSIITLDMGGTSADVAHYRDHLDYMYENTVGDATILSPALAIHTVAAGGGSICGFDGYRLTVGPESAGADPGPACYGKGGPLTLTDISLLLGRIDPSSFQIPVNTRAAELALEHVITLITRSAGTTAEKQDILEGFLQIANEKMADAIRAVSIRKGHDPSEYTFLVFGGAGGQYACDIAEELGMESILVPYDGGLLCAYGIGKADLEQFAEEQVLELLGHSSDLGERIQRLKDQIIDQFTKTGFEESEVLFKDTLFYCRYAGQESTIEISAKIEHLEEVFTDEYRRVVGHKLDRDIEIESIKLIGYIPNRMNIYNEESVNRYTPEKQTIYNWEHLTPGAQIEGPVVVTNKTSTLYIKKGWKADLDSLNNFRLTKSAARSERENTLQQVQLELFTNRFRGIAELMGAILERTSFSVNIKERLDFSCALLDQNGYLIVNAPHIPVHLGSMGVCVRSVLSEISLGEGEVVITNHPAYGGSHLPDITLIAPVYSDGELIAYVANRAHHAEIGGVQPGSMPTNARSLEEEGVVISPQLFATQGEVHWDRIEEVLTKYKYPTRNLKENIADLTGALASINAGVEGIQGLCDRFGKSAVREYLNAIKVYASQKASESISKLSDDIIEETELLDDGRELRCRIIKSGGSIQFDFAGTSEQAAGNMNATPAIVNSTILYVLRLLIDEDIPLNEGIMDHVEVILPESLLNPRFSDPSTDPAVVGGNTEVSQRLTDLLLKALKMAACSQGTMNNLVFGNDNFGFYETICGGTGAGDGFDGSDAVHQHMTNTRITDPEVMEHRYPVQVEQFSIREQSGGKGKWKGGDGIIRSIKFLEPVTLNLLSQHRVESPFGLSQGSDGIKGDQYIIREDGEKEELPGVFSAKLNQGDVFTIETPGGGGFGKP